jgi:hypothetical protein
MMKKNSFILGILALALIFGLVLTGCSTDGGSGDGSEEIFDGTPSSKGITQPLPADDLISALTSGDVSDLSDLIAKGGELYVNGEKVTSGSIVIQPDDTVKIIAPKDTADNNGSGSLPEKDAQVYWGDGEAYTGNGTVKLTYWDEEKTEEISIADAGTVTGGKLTLNLPSSVPSQHLTRASESLGGMPGITVTPNDVQTYMTRLSLFEGDTLLDRINLVKESENTSYSINYWYFSKAATIIGTVTDRGTTATLNISAKAGWNAVSQDYSGSESGGTMTMATDLSKVPSDIKWTIDGDSPSGGK